MPKKWWFGLASILVLAGLVAIGVLVLVPPTPGVSYANYSRIEIGMPRSNVEALLGKPIVGRGSMLVSHWRTETADHVVVNFDEKNRVESLTWNLRIEERTTWEKLRDRLPLFARKPPEAVYAW